MVWLGTGPFYKPPHGRKFGISKAVTPVSAVSEEKPWETLDENSPYFCRDRGLNRGPPEHTLAQVYCAQVLQLMH